MKSDTNIFATNQFSYPMIGLLIATVTLLVLTVIISSAVSAFDPNATKYVFVKKWGSKVQEMDNLCEYMTLTSILQKHVSMR